MVGETIVPASKDVPQTLIWPSPQEVKKYGRWGLARIDIASIEGVQGINLQPLAKVDDIYYIWSKGCLPDGNLRVIVGSEYCPHNKLPGAGRGISSKNLAAMVELGGNFPIALSFEPTEDHLYTRFIPVFEIEAEEPVSSS